VLCEEQAGETTYISLTVYQSQGSGDKYNATTLPASLDSQMIASAYLGNQFGPDLFEDLLLVLKTDVVTFESTGFCNFAPTWTEVTMGPGLVSIATGDLNDDGYIDLVTPLKNGNVAVAMGFNAIGFEAPDHSLKTGSSNLGMSEVADINGDGFLDILVVDRGGSGILTFMNIGDGRFWPKPHVLRTGVEPSEFKVVDFNHDDCLDIATLSPKSKAASLLINKVGQFGGCVLQP
jgi:hypothetical protein